MNAYEALQFAIRKLRESREPLDVISDAEELAEHDAAIEMLETISQMRITLERPSVDDQLASLLCGEPFGADRACGRPKGHWGTHSWVRQP